MTREMQPQANATPDRARTAPGRAGPLTLRLVLSLVLCPLVLGGSAILSTTFARTSWFAPVQARGIEEDQLWLLLMTTAVMLASWIIWRRAVAWGTGRWVGTLLIAAAPIAHVSWWQPLWSVGLFSSILPIAQCIAVIGAWVWITVGVWWGWERNGDFVREGLRMTDSARRVMLAYGLIPFVVGGYVITLILLYQLRWFSPPPRDANVLICNNVLWACVVTGVWLLNWRRAVVWDRRSWFVTSIAALGLVLIAGGAPLLPQIPQISDVARTMLPLIAWGGWMLVTMLMWSFRPSAAGQLPEERLRCRACGYSLRGLYATRCPECGDQPTLDELFARGETAHDA